MHLICPHVKKGDVESPHQSKRARDKNEGIFRDEVHIFHSTTAPLLTIAIADIIVESLSRNTYTLRKN